MSRGAREIREDRGTDHFTGVVENSPGGAQFTSPDHWLDPLEMCASGGFAPGWCVGIGAVVSQHEMLDRRTAAVQTIERKAVEVRALPEPDGTGGG
jgi:hypothetical protein